MSKDGKVFVNPEDKNRGKDGAFLNKRNCGRWHKLAFLWMKFRLEKLILKHLLGKYLSKFPIMFSNQSILTWEYKHMMKWIALRNRPGTERQTKSYQSDLWFHLVLQCQRKELIVPAIPQVSRSWLISRLLNTWIILGRICNAFPPTPASTF